MLLDLRRMVFAKFQHLPIAFHENFTSGRVISRLTSDPDALNELIDKPEALAFPRISNWAGREPLNFPPLAVRRQVAIAVTWGWYSIKRLIRGRASAGLGR